MPAASLMRACSWHFGVSLFAGIEHRHELRRWLPVTRGETRLRRVRHQIVADPPGSPAGVLDFEHRENEKGAVLEPSRLAWLAADSDQPMGRCGMLCRKHDCRPDDYDLSN